MHVERVGDDVPDDVPDLTWEWSGLADRAAAEPTSLPAWRNLLAAATSRQYAVDVPPSMPEQFVLQWALEVAAEVGVHAASHHAWVVHPASAGLTFDLHPQQLYPVRARFRHASVTPALLEDRVQAARAAYLAAGRRLALAEPAWGRVGEHQRLALVEDVWAMAWARSRGQGPVARGSCCFIYVLPGVHECAGCPRLRRGAGGRG